MILVTGGAGYIGSHTVAELLAEGYCVHIADNFANSTPAVITRLERISGKTVPYTRVDVRDGKALRELFARNKFKAVIHFAGVKSIGESVCEPLRYYDHNVCGSVALLDVMRERGLKRLVFSSSATVYGAPQSVPILETFPLSPTNPYGRSKLIVEDISRDLAMADPDWAIALLRYFNPVGAHESGLIGEEPSGIPNNLMPYITQVAAGIRPQLSIFGADHPTRDGTGVRDYVHVVDLARAHVAALAVLLDQSGLLTLNVGTGRGYSVLEVLQTFENATGCKVPFRIVSRRPGDVAQCYADTTLCNRTLRWSAQRGLKQMCIDAWRWEKARSENELLFRPITPHVG